MQLVTPLIALACAGVLVEASGHSSFEVVRMSNKDGDGQHGRLARRARSFNGRCGAQSKHKNQTPSAEPKAAVPQTGINSNYGAMSILSQGLVNVLSSCGPIGATLDVTPVSGPNGGIDWLNCGVNAGGWQPPYVTVNDLITKDLSTAIQEPNSPFKACSSFVDLFEQYAKENGVPSILIASIAMQESTCNADTQGGAGEQGLMQLTQDKCGAAPNGNCKDPAYNIRTGAHYFANTLKNNNGNVLLTLGNYNGWPEGMTYGQAVAAADGPCCRCQNNLDYIHQNVNGWMQNINPYESKPRIGKYFNLDKCFS